MPLLVADMAAMLAACRRLAWRDFLAGLRGQHDYATGPPMPAARHFAAEGFSMTL